MKESGSSASITDTYIKHVTETLKIQNILHTHAGWEQTYRVLFMPSFHPEVCITVQIKSDTAQIQLLTVQTNLWYYRMYIRHQDEYRNKDSAIEGLPPTVPTHHEEIAAIPEAQANEFLFKMKSLRPIKIPNLKTLNLDGMGFQGEYCDDKRKHNLFEAHNPELASKQYKFAHTLYNLAENSLKGEASIKVLESIYRYLSLGIPIKKLGGNPCRVRIFGSLGYYEKKEIEVCLKEISNAIPVLMEMDNFEGMGILIYPIFSDFIKHRKNVKTAWWAVSPYVKRQLTEIGIPLSNIFDTREGALKNFGN